jgi:hypothetical protein
LDGNKDEYYEYERQAQRGLHAGRRGLQGLRQGGALRHVYDINTVFSRASTVTGETED